MSENGCGRPIDSSASASKKTSHECQECGDSFGAYRDNPKFCSPECYDSARGGIYQDKGWLREKYVVEGLKVKEILELAGCSRTTLYDWLDKHGIDRDRDRGVAQAEGKYKDKEWLKSEYVDNRRSMGEIASDFDVSKETIKYWLKKHNIPIRGRSESAKIRSERYPEEMPKGRDASIHPNMFTRDSRSGGYVWIGCGVTKKQVQHHRLLATLLVDDLSELEGMHVHHKDEIPWLNYLDGLEVVTPKEHKARHVE